MCSGFVALLFVFSVLAKSCFCASPPGSIVLIVPNNDTSISKSQPTANVTYGLDDTHIPAQSGYMRNVTFILQYPNNTLSFGGSVFGCGTFPGSTYSFTRTINAAGLYTINAYVIYSYPEVSGSCVGPWNNETELVTAKFLVQNRSGDTIGSLTTTTLTLPVAPTGSVQANKATLLFPPGLGKAVWAVLMAISVMAFA